MGSLGQHDKIKHDLRWVVKEGSNMSWIRSLKFYLITIDSSLIHQTTCSTYMSLTSVDSGMSTSYRGDSKNCGRISSTWNLTASTGVLLRGSKTPLGMAEMPSLYWAPISNCMRPTIWSSPVSMSTWKMSSPGISSAPRQENAIFHNVLVKHFKFRSVKLAPGSRFTIQIWRLRFTLN